MSQQLPPITVVIPAYNLQNYVGDAIDSAAKQSYSGQLSIIVLDDGSSDQTLHVAQSVAGRYPNVSVLSQPNQGRVGARNRLLELAQTELVAWIDGDDMAPPTWVEQQYQLMCTHPDSVAVSGQGYAMTARALPIGPIPRPLTPDEISSRHINGQSNAFFQSCTLVKKSAVVAAGAYRPTYPAAEDYDLWLRLAERGTLRNHQQCHLYYRVHPTSANATVGVQQRQQGFESCNEARLSQGLEVLPRQAEQPIPPQKKDEWNRSVFWINIALKAGNPWTAKGMIVAALIRHPRSLLLWILLAVAMADSLLFFGNRTQRFESGKQALLGQLPYWSIYRFGRWLYYRIKGKPSISNAVD
jgi:Glycosyl transferase family 2